MSVDRSNNNSAESQHSFNPPNGMATSILRRTAKVPAGLLQTLKKMSKNNNNQEEHTNKFLKSSLAEALSAKIKALMNVVKCEIC